MALVSFSCAFPYLQVFPLSSAAVQACCRGDDLLEGTTSSGMAYAGAPNLGDGANRKFVDIRNHFRFLSARRKALMIMVFRSVFEEVVNRLVGKVGRGEGE